MSCNIKCTFLKWIRAECKRILCFILAMAVIISLNTSSSIAFSKKTLLFFQEIELYLMRF